MSASLNGDATPAATRARGVLDARIPAVAHYGLALLLVVVATGLAALIQEVMAAANLTLVYVLPVVIAASVSGWGPAAVAVISGAAAYDFFFTEPYYSLTMTNPPEIWAMALLLIIATIVASVSATARRRALDADESAERAEALQAVAHAVIHARTHHDVLQAAAAALHRMFRAPAVVLERHGDAIGVAATAGGALIRDLEREAAGGALSMGLSTRGENYPYNQTPFDFWPVRSKDGAAFVLGVDFSRASRERPAGAERLVEGVAGYISASSARA